jgi:hypothetical protein
VSVEVPAPEPTTATPAAAPVRTPDDTAPAPAPGYAPVFTATTPATGQGTTRSHGAQNHGVARHWAATAVAVLVMTAFAVDIISGRVVTEGPVLLTLSRTHGIHLGDLYVVAAWLLGAGTSVIHSLRQQRAGR